MKTERQGLLFLPQAGLQKKNQVQLEHIYATNQEVDIKKKISSNNRSLTLQLF